MSPQSPRGNIEQAKAKFQVAMRILEDLVPVFGHDSPEGQMVLKMINMGAKKMGRSEDRAQQILPAELKSALLNQQPPMGQPPGQPPGGAGGALPPGGAPMGA